jgi:hypothetical protein
MGTKHPAIKELYEIIKKEDWTSFCPEKNRAELLEKWEQKWLANVDSTQLIMDKKYLTSDYSDMIKEKMAQNLAEQLTEECVQFNITDRSIKAQMLGIRRKER